MSQESRVMKTYIFVDYLSLDSISPDGFDALNWHFSIFMSKDFRTNHVLQTLKNQLQKQCRLYQSSKASDEYLDDMMKLKIGELHAKTSKQANFIIITHRKSFDHIVSILNKEGRKCTRLATCQIDNISNSLSTNAQKSSIDIEAYLSEKIFSDEAQNIIRNLFSYHPKRRPKTVSKVKNYITNFYKDYDYKEDLTIMLMDEFTSKGFITIESESKVKFHFTTDI